MDTLLSSEIGGRICGGAICVGCAITDFHGIFQNLFHRSWMKIFLILPYILIMILLKVQLKVTLIEIRQKEVQRNSIIFNSCCQI